MLMLHPQIQISESELEFTYVRSSGPGGQNVNKVNSKAVLRWNPVESSGLLEPLRSFVLQRLAQQLTVAGELVVSSDVFRDQPRNREECLRKLKEILLKACHRPKKRVKTKPGRSAREKAKTSKKLHSHKKQQRRSSGGYDS